MLAEAFLDDPVWAALGPRRRTHRRRSNRIFFRGMLARTRRAGAWIRVARGEGGRVLGAAVAFDPGRWPMSEVSIGWELGWVLAAGPLPVRRGLGFESAIRACHVSHPHLYLWFIGVEPELHGRGIGRALLTELHARSAALAVPTFLETSSEPNVSFYQRQGYELLGEIALPGGPPMWRLERPPTR